MAKRLRVEDFTESNINKCLTDFDKDPEALTDKQRLILESIASNFPPFDNMSLFVDLLYGLNVYFNGDLTNILASATKTFNYIKAEENVFNSDKEAGEYALLNDAAIIVPPNSFSGSAWRVAVVMEV